MRKILFVTILFIGVLTLSAGAQILTPVHWSYAAKKINDREAVIFMRASIEDNWHLYAQYVKEGGPVKTTFTFNRPAGYDLNGPTTEPTPFTRYEKVFNMEVSFFEHEVVFQQKIKLRANNIVVKGKVTFMTCNDKQCLPPEEVTFSIPVK